MPVPVVAIPGRSLQATGANKYSFRAGVHSLRHHQEHTRTMPTSPANGGNEHSIGIHDAERTAITKRRKLTEGLDRLVFCVAFMEWAGNAIGTLAFIWATVVLLGGFCSLLSRKDFWFSTVMIFMEGSRCVPTSI